MSAHENCPCMEECPLNRVLKLIGGKWKMQILCSLHNNGPTRYNQLKRTLDGVSNTVLAGALRELEADGFLLRRDFHEVPPRVEYTLTDLGQSFITVLNVMKEWGDRNLPPSDG